MKGQDIGLLLKLACLQKKEQGNSPVYTSDSWEDWSVDESNEPVKVEDAPGYYHQYTVRALAQLTGISKSQINLSLQRSFDSGLAIRDRKIDVPRANIRALSEFIVYGLRYVFPVKPGALPRGISTSLAAPVLEGKLSSAGELPPVWSDAKGNTRGQVIEPLFKSVPYAVRLDAELYALLALVDAIRVGQSRERNLAIKLLSEHLEVLQ